MKQKRLTIKVAPHTFGGTPASENLSKILTENYPQLVSKVGAYYSKFTEHSTNCIYAAIHFPNGSLETMMLLYKNHIFESIKESGMPTVVISHLLNVMTVSYRKSLYIARRLMLDANNKKV
jgi:hypothetical protein